MYMYVYIHMYIYIYHGTPHCPGVFRYLDTSHDGDISAREFETLERVWRELQQSMFEPLGPGGWVNYIWVYIYMDVYMIYDIGIYDI